MPTCQNCGEEVPPGNNFCAGCGAPAVSGPPAPAPQVPGVQPPQAPAVAKAQKKGLSKGAKIAIILGVVAVLLVITTVVLFVVFVADVISGPADVANGYMKALNDGDFSTAWNYFSKEAQEEEGGLSEFRSGVGALEGNITKWSTSGIRIVNDRAQVEMDVTLSGNTEATWDIYLVKVGGFWKIGGISPR